MSDYHREKVLRVPFEAAGLNKEDYDDLDHDLWQKFGDIFCWNGDRVGKFEASPTRKLFIDYILEDEYGADCGEYGKIRELYPSEKLKYIEVFQKLNPDIDMDKVKLVEFCWYNCSEAPDYYDPMDDEFYLEVPFICSFI